MTHQRFRARIQFEPLRSNHALRNLVLLLLLLLLRLRAHTGAHTRTHTLTCDVRRNRIVRRQMDFAWRAQRSSPDALVLRIDSLRRMSVRRGLKLNSRSPKAIKDSESISGCLILRLALTSPDLSVRFKMAGSVSTNGQARRKS